MSSQNSSTDPEQPEPRRGLDAVLPPAHRDPQPAAPSDVVPHPVDQVAIRKLGGFNLITPEQWSAMSTDSRRKLIKAGVVNFLFEGDEVPLKAALLGLRRQQELEAQANQVERSRLGSVQPSPRPAES